MGDARLGIWKVSLYISRHWSYENTVKNVGVSKALVLLGYDATSIDSHYFVSG